MSDLEPISVVLIALAEMTVEATEAAKAWTASLASLGRTHEIIVSNAACVGAALRDGIARAQFPLLFYTTCDAQFQPADVTRLLEALDQKIEMEPDRKLDLVTGYRVAGPVPGWLAFLSTVRRVAMRVLFGMEAPRRDSWLGWSGWRRRWKARWLFGVAVLDPECPFRLFRRGLFRRIAIQSDSEFAHIEILAKANFLGALIAEIPVAWTSPKAAPAPSASPGPTGEAYRLFTKPDFGPPFLGA